MARHARRLGAVLILMLAVAGCDGGPMGADTAMMRRWAEEMDREASQLREHLQGMRQLAPEQWYAQRAEHASVVTDALGRMERRMDEMRQMGSMRMRGMGMGGMGMGTPMSSVGPMMGMSGDEHQDMLRLMEVLQSDAEQLRTASVAEVMERMPGHLKRLEALVAMMEQSAAHMRSGREMGGMGWSGRS